jgi:hypothetical protein
MLRLEHDLFGKPVPTFPDHVQAIKKPRTFIRRGSVRMMAAVMSYARATPEAPWASLVFVAVLTVDIMARDHMDGGQARQRLLPAFA